MAIACVALAGSPATVDLTVSTFVMTSVLSLSRSARSACALAFASALPNGLAAVAVSFACALATLAGTRAIVPGRLCARALTLSGVAFSPSPIPLIRTRRAATSSLASGFTSTVTATSPPLNATFAIDLRAEGESPDL